MEWFEMGGYATYVWPVFGTAFLLVIGIALAPRLQHRRLIKELRVERQIDSED
ncbi:MAG: heme exporter protein CcmD [Gammaproteobacteria bacterium]|nr:heme exporter protein CcmD [Gammaproteobacteria bacterium]